MKILSLFDGISCARVALERAGIPVESYYASEIDKYAIQVSKKNYPEIKQLGSVTDICYDLGQFCRKTGGYASSMGIEYINDIDLLIGGSPCQDLSIAKKNRKGLDGERSGLFWEYVRILNEVKPKYFILENVNSMPKEAKELITKTLGVEPIMINASLVSAQNRKRLFWVGKRVGLTVLEGKPYYEKVEMPQPEDRGILLKDIFDLSRPRKWFRKNIIKTRSGVKWDESGKGYFSQQDRAYSLEGKFPTIPTARTVTKINVVNSHGDICKLDWDEVEKLQSLPIGYTDLGEGNRIEKRGGVIGNAFNVDVVAHILSFIPC